MENLMAWKPNIKLVRKIFFWHPIYIHQSATDINSSSNEPWSESRLRQVILRNLRIWFSESNVRERQCCTQPKNNEHVASNWSHLGGIKERMKRAAEANQAAGCNYKQENVSTEIHWFTGEAIHDWRVWASHDQNTYASIIQLKQYFENLGTVNETQMEDSRASKTETDWNHVHYQWPSMNIRKYFISANYIADYQFIVICFPLADVIHYSFIVLFQLY